MPTFKDVDPRELRLLPSRDSGVEMWKYHRQVSKFGTSTVGMPPILVFEATDGVLVVYDGITRATRIAKLAPGTLVPVEELPGDSNELLRTIPRLETDCHDDSNPT